MLLHEHKGTQQILAEDCGDCGLRDLRSACLTPSSGMRSARATGGWSRG